MAEPLFNRKTLDRQLAATPQVTETALAVLRSWASTIRDGSLITQSETEVEDQFKRRIVEDVLGYRPFNDSGSWTVASKAAIGAGAVDLALGHFSRREDRDITDGLYRLYKEQRASLIGAVQADKPDMPAIDAIGVAQTILDRVLFIAFAEDNGLLPDDSLLRAFEHSDPYNPRPVWQNFLGLFRAIDQGNAALQIPRYNGGLFGRDPVILDLSLPDAICEGFKRLAEYDFASEVSVTVLGHIFEQSIADVETLQAEALGEAPPQAKASGTSGRRKRDGVVYTPDYVARFIVDQTLSYTARVAVSVAQMM